MTIYDPLRIYNDKIMLFDEPVGTFTGSSHRRDELENLFLEYFAFDEVESMKNESWEEGKSDGLKEGHSDVLDDLDYSFDRALDKEFADLPEELQTRITLFIDAIMSGAKDKWEK